MNILEYNLYLHNRLCRSRFEIDHPLHDYNILMNQNHPTNRFTIFTLNYEEIIISFF